MYSFKHALTQDVVYSGVLERRRRSTTRRRAAASRSCARAGRRRRRADRVPLRARAGVGQGRDLSEAGRGQGPGEVGAPGGAGLARRGAGGAPPPARDAGDAAARDRRAPRAPGLALPARRVREDAGVSAGSRGHGQRDLRFAPARVGLHPDRRILPPDGAVRRGANARRKSAGHGRQAAGLPAPKPTRASISGLPATPSATTGAPPELLRAVMQAPRPEGRTGALAAW